jgi:hypothetical protein
MFWGWCNHCTDFHLSFSFCKSPAIWSIPIRVFFMDQSCSIFYLESCIFLGSLIEVCWSGKTALFPYVVFVRDEGSMMLVIGLLSNDILDEKYCCLFYLHDPLTVYSCMKILCSTFSSLSVYAIFDWFVWQDLSFGSLCDVLDFIFNPPLCKCKLHHPKIKALVPIDPSTKILHYVLVFSWIMLNIGGIRDARNLIKDTPIGMEKH